MKLNDMFNTFERMKLSPIQPDKWTYNTLIEACSEYPELYSKAEHIYNSMLEQNHKPDSFTYGMLIDICGKMEQPEKLLSILAAMQQNGITPNEITYFKALIGLGKCRSSETVTLFKKLQEEGFEITETLQYALLVSAKFAKNPQIYGKTIKELETNLIQPVSTRMASLLKTIDIVYGSNFCKKYNLQ